MQWIRCDYKEINNKPVNLELCFTFYKDVVYPNIPSIQFSGNGDRYVEWLFNRKEERDKEYDRIVKMLWDYSWPGPG